MIRRFSQFLSIASLFLALSANAPSQTSASHVPNAKTKSAPTARTLRASQSNGKSAVLKGDAISLQGLYLPTTQGTVPDGQAVNPTQEVAFWSSLHNAGLTGMDPKVLLRQTPQSGQIVLLMRVYLTIQDKGESRDFVLSLTQLWTQEDGTWKIAASRRSNPVPKPAIRLPEPAVPNPDLYPDPSEAQKDLDCSPRRRYEGPQKRHRSLRRELVLRLPRPRRRLPLRLHRSNHEGQLSRSAHQHRQLRRESRHSRAPANPAKKGRPSSSSPRQQRPTPNQPKERRIRIRLQNRPNRHNRFSKSLEAQCRKIARYIDPSDVGAGLAPPAPRNPHETPHHSPPILRRSTLHNPIWTKMVGI